MASVTNQTLSELKIARSVNERVNGRKGGKDGRCGNLQLQAVLEGRVQPDHATDCKHAAKLRSDTVGMERCTEKIICIP
jgi:hypothetical protein